jgi:hypothetical protein
VALTRQPWFRGYRKTLGMVSQNKIMPPTRLRKVAIPRYPATDPEPLGCSRLCEARCPMHRPSKTFPKNQRSAREPNALGRHAP